MKVIWLFLIATGVMLASDGVTNWKQDLQSRTVEPLAKRLVRSNAIEQEREKGLKYLNTLRTSAHLIPYKSNTSLDIATQNHIDYMIHENSLVHNEEKKDSPYFTGLNPWDRGSKAGYPFTGYYNENITRGNEDIQEAIDGLMNAIYHRLGFLNFNNDEIGIGSKEGWYAFDMANQNTWEKNRKHNPKYTLWPPSDYIAAQTSFNNNEKPDPVPECPRGGIIGSPISIAFNPAKNDTIIMDSFKLYDGNGAEITNIKDPAAVPNLDVDHQFVLFPMTSLSLDSRYRAEFKYIENGTSETISWYFRTKRYEDKRYEAIDGESYDVISGTSYLFHLKHNDCTTIINRWRSSSKTTIQYLYTDLYRISVKQNTTITFYNDDDSHLQITLNVSNTDTAIPPSTDTVTQPLPMKSNVGMIIPIINYLLF